MATISRIEPRTPVTAPVRRAPAARFSIGGALPPAAEPPGAGQVAGLLGLDGLLALQEADTSDVAEREARRHGQTLLAQLTRLQLARLSPTGLAAGDLARLAELAGTMPFTADPALATVLQAIALRARVELARR